MEKELRSLYDDYKILYGDFKRLERENEFLKERENKLQLIEQMYKNESVDLSELAKLVKGSDIDEIENR